MDIAKSSIFSITYEDLNNTVLSASISEKIEVNND